MLQTVKKSLRSFILMYDDALVPDQILPVGAAINVGLGFSILMIYRYFRERVHFLYGNWCRGLLVRLALVLGVGCFTMLASPVSAETLERVGPIIPYPWGVSFIAEDEVVVTARGGDMHRINIATGAAQKITGTPEVYASGQGGLLDVLAHGKGEGQRLYFCFSRQVDSLAATSLMVARLEGDKLVEQELLFTSNTPHSGGRHFGCRIIIKDGMVHLSLGDRGNRDDSQDMDSHSGAVIRLPLENGGEAEIFAKGLRNPQGMAVHPGSNAIWVGGHGPKGGDEINILAKGANYGWPIVSHGKEYFGGKVGEGLKSAPGFTDPIWVWVPSIAPAGMAFYDGEMFPEWKGDLLVSSLKFRSLYHVEIENGQPARETPLLKNRIGRIRDVEIVPDGSVLLLSDESEGGVYRLSR
jgi:glucose/arabinose dehydrogenase